MMVFGDIFVYLYCNWTDPTLPRNVGAWTSGSGEEGPSRAVPRIGVSTFVTRPV